MRGEKEKELLEDEFLLFAEEGFGLGGLATEGADAFGGRLQARAGLGRGVVDRGHLFGEVARRIVERDEIIFHQRIELVDSERSARDFGIEVHDERRAEEHGIGGEFRDDGIAAELL